MKEYHKIQTVFKRDPNNNFKTLIEGDYSKPEFKYLAFNNWIFTEKIDGTNIRVMWNDGKIIFGGKTDNSQIPTKLLYKLQEIFTIEKMSNVFKNVDVCLYGEGYGNKIQKGGNDYIPDGVDFILFDAKIKEWWLLRENVEDIAKDLSINVVPIVGNGNLTNAVQMVKKGFNSFIGKRKAEGLVIRPECELYSRYDKRIITKIKSKDFA